MTDSSPRELSPKPRTKLFTRRRILIAGGGLVGAGALASGGVLLFDQYLRHVRDADATMRDHRVDLPATTPRMVIARGVDPATNTRAAVEKLGGLRPFVRPDEVVLIKPNIGWQRTPEQGANTHPEVVAELVRLCRDAGVKRVLVSDCPVRRSRGAFVRSGILEAAQRAGAEVIIPEDSTHRTVQISARLGTWDILEPFVVADRIINVPVVKSHELTGVTAGMKNWIGITNLLRVKFHTDLQQSIAELAALMRPTLTVADASRVLMEHGPAGGSLDDVKPVHAVAAGVDPVAIDAWAMSLFDLTEDQYPGYLEIVERMGLGSRDWRGLQPVEVFAG